MNANSLQIVWCNLHPPVPVLTYALPSVISPNVFQVWRALPQFKRPVVTHVLLVEKGGNHAMRNLSSAVGCEALPSVS